jgi:hypothetical protein
MAWTARSRTGHSASSSPVPSARTSVRSALTQAIQEQYPASSQFAEARRSWSDTSPMKHKTPLGKGSSGPSVILHDRTWSSPTMVHRISARSRCSQSTARGSHSDARLTQRPDIYHDGTFDTRPFLMSEKDANSGPPVPVSVVDFLHEYKTQALELEDLQQSVSVLENEKDMLMRNRCKQALRAWASTILWQQRIGNAIGLAIRKGQKDKLTALSSWKNTATLEKVQVCVKCRCCERGARDWIQL